jgi:hypothetical protein
VAGAALLLAAALLCLQGVATVTDAKALLPVTCVHRMNLVINASALRSSFLVSTHNLCICKVQALILECSTWCRYC